MNDWWYEAFPQLPYQPAPPGARQMPILVAYDISDPKWKIEDGRSKFGRA